MGVLSKESEAIKLEALGVDSYRSEHYREHLSILVGESRNRRLTGSLHLFRLLLWERECSYCSPMHG